MCVYNMYIFATGKKYILTYYKFLDKTLLTDENQNEIQGWISIAILERLSLLRIVQRGGAEGAKQITEQGIITQILFIIYCYF